MVEFLKFDRDFWQPVLFTVSLQALFRKPGVATLAGPGGCPGARPAMQCPFPPAVPMCCFEVTKLNPDLRKGGSLFERIAARWGKGMLCRGRRLLQ